MNREQFVSDWLAAIDSGSLKSLYEKYNMSRQGIHYWLSKYRGEGIHLPPMPRHFSDKSVAKKASKLGVEKRWKNVSK